MNAYLNDDIPSKSETATFLIPNTIEVSYFNLSKNN